MKLKFSLLNKFTPLFQCFVLFMLLLQVASAQYSWKQKTNFGGAVRLGAFGFSIDSLGYVGTGDNGSGFKYQDFWQYSPATNAWTQKSNFPMVLTASSSFVINGHAYITGGALSSGLNSALWMYDPV